MTQQTIDSPMDYALSLFPPSELGKILLIALAVFAFTQVLKVIFRNSEKLPTLGQTALRLVAVASAFPLAYAIWPVREWLAVTPIALVAWGLSHVTAEYGMRALEEFFPRIYRVFNGDRRKPEGTLPPDGTPERRK